MALEHLTALVLELDGERWFSASRTGTRIDSPLARELPAGAYVELRCDRTADGALEVQAVRELSPGSDDLAGQVGRYLWAGEAEHGLRVLEAAGDARVTGDPALLAGRVELGVRVGDQAGAAEDFRRLLRTPGAHTTWLSILFGRFDADHQQALRPDLAAWAASTSAPIESYRVRRTLGLLELRQWTDEQLLGRLALHLPRSEGREREEVIAPLVAEARRRGLSADPRLAAGEAKLTQLQQRDAEDELQPILRTALRAVKPGLRPPPPYHLGGPMVKIAGRQPLGLLPLCLRAAAHRVPEEERERFARIVSLVERGLAREEQPAELAGLLQETRGATPMAVAEQAHAALAPGQRHVFHPVQKAAQLAARVLAATRAAPGRTAPTRNKPPATARATARARATATATPTATRFLRDLDAELALVELRGLLAGREPEAARAVERVLWRGTDERGSLAYIIALVRGGDHALYARLKGRWRWHVGPRDDVLATVPDHAFEQATWWVLG